MREAALEAVAETGGPPAAADRALTVAGWHPRAHLWSRAQARRPRVAATPERPDPAAEAPRSVGSHLLPQPRAAAAVPVAAPEVEDRRLPPQTPAAVPTRQYRAARIPRGRPITARRLRAGRPRAAAAELSRTSGDGADVIFVYGIAGDIPLPAPNAIRRFFSWPRRKIFIPCSRRRRRGRSTPRACVRRRGGLGARPGRRSPRSRLSRDSPRCAG